MAIQSSVSVDIAYGVETTFGTAATATAGKALRRVSTSLTTQKESFQSNEVRRDLQVSDLRHGMRSARGSIEGELSIQSYDDLLEAAFGGTWTAGVSVDPDDFATGVTVTTVGETSLLTFAGAGSLLTAGFKVGDVVRCTGLTAAANNNLNLRIVALDATAMTVYPAITAQAQQAEDWAVAVAGKKLLLGTTKRSFTIENIYTDIDESEQFTGCRINGVSINCQPNGMVTSTFDVLGQNGSLRKGAQSPYFTTIADAPNTEIVSGLNGALRLAGQEVGIVTAFDLSLTNNMSVAGVVGKNVSPDVFAGRKVLTGNVSAYLQDGSLIEAFLDEEEVDIVAQLLTASGSPQDFITLSMQRVKFSSNTKTIGAEGGVIAQFAYQALLANGGSGTNLDATTIAIQRSNS
ncbi:hypothetical protein KL86PLE_100238 [uncultured Pleomorphomonas sp.]|uniref:Uncharacterized protein n=1 Tax=uncultured Pleomorphomonas sp. TaxID=442121 RepID=A0A212L1Y8_9HYPH|nr:phage tail tube protein [uncultured Pleomorphomonas sp.]SCM71497.1 hypothetical protein KL86PLE_100238 [uncultured Pleomorphomonas sp.]